MIFVIGLAWNPLAEASDWGARISTSRCRPVPPSRRITRRAGHDCRFRRPAPSGNRPPREPIDLAVRRGQLSLDQLGRAAGAGPDPQADRRGTGSYRRLWCDSSFASESPRRSWVPIPSLSPLSITWPWITSCRSWSFISKRPSPTWNATAPRLTDSATAAEVQKLLEIKKRHLQTIEGAGCQGTASG